MTSSLKQASRPLFLGIEGGGSHTVAILADEHGNLLQRFEAGPANLKILSDSQLLALLKSIARVFPKPDTLAIGMAGARTEMDWGRIRAAAGKVWKGIPCHATNDLETALVAGGQKAATQEAARVLVLSGTGSCCYGRSATGKTVKVGGWGHVLGDKGSGYDIALTALKAVLVRFDRHDEWSKLGTQILHRLEFNEPNELIAWAQSVDKSQIATLATEVFDARSKGDKVAAEILDAAEKSLAEDAVACAQRLVKAKAPVRFVLAGSVLLKQPEFAKRVAARLSKTWPGAVVSALERESAWGAVVLAQKNAGSLVQKNPAPAKLKTPKVAKASLEMPLANFGQVSPTEQRNPRSLKLDKLLAAQAIDLMLSEDAKIPAAIAVERKKIAEAVEFISYAFQHGGRLFYIGAGTSGRLGVLDASECPPTFRTDPNLVQGIIAGGQGALWRSVEGAEDDPEAGARAIKFRDINRRDVVVGIAASGRTPFVWGGLHEAQQRGAKTILLAFNPFVQIPAGARPNLVITPNVGPEILTGSTRLKSGTATKLVLNIFTTLAMVRIGKVASNLMIDLNPSNIKLQDRAVRILRELCGVDYETAKKALEDSRWVIKDARARLAGTKRRR